jgi:MFS family permease
MLGPSGPPFPQNYAQMFGIAAAMFLTAGVCLMSLVEMPATIGTQPGPRLNEYLPYLGNVLRTDRAFQRFTLTRTLIDLTAICAPFYIIFGANYLKLPSASLVGDSVLLATAGSALGAVMMGWLSHHSGSRAVIALCGIASCLHPAFGLLSYSLGQPALYTALFLLGFVTSATIPGYFDWIITHAPPDHRPIYVGLTNTISAGSHLAPFVGGLLLSLTESRFSILFGFGGVLGLLGTISVIFLAEPRQRSLATQAN